MIEEGNKKNIYFIYILLRFLSYTKINKNNVGRNKMKKFKKFIALMALATVTAAAVGCSSTNAGQPEGNAQTDTAKPSEGEDLSEEAKVVVAKVGDQEVTLADVKKEMAYLEQILMMQFGEDYKNNEDAMSYYKEQQKLILDYLVESKLIIQDAKDLGIKVSDKDVQAEIDKVKEKFGSEEAFTAALEQEGMTLDFYSNFVKENLIIAKTLEEVTKDVTVTDEEVTKAYEDNIATYTTPAGANMAHILVDTEEKAKDIKKQYEEGKDFAELAAEFGTDGTKETGGSLGYIAYDSSNYDADFLAGAKNLKEGEVSNPVKTQFGWHLIKVTGVQSEAVVKPLEEVKDQAKATALQQNQYEVFEKHIDSLKEKIKVEIFEDKLA